MNEWGPLANLALAAPLYVGSVLVGGGVAKLRDFRGAWVGVLDYRIVPRFLARPLAAVLALSEIGCGLALMLGVAMAGPLAVLLFGIVTAAAISVLVRQLEIDCHCGPGAERLTVHTLGRNTLLMLVLVVVSDASANVYPLEPRLLSISTAAALCIGFEVVFTLLLFVAARIWMSSSQPPRQRRLVAN